MSRRFDLLALDVDGTLVDESGLVSRRLARALGTAREQGVRVCLCTGRPLAATQAYCEQLDPTTPPVVFNGALVPALDGGAPLVRRPLPSRAVAPLVAEARAHGDHLELHTAERCYVERMGPEGRWQRDKLGVEAVVGPFEDMPADAVLLKGQVVILAEKRQRWETFGPALAPDAILSWGVSPAFDGHFINIMAAGVEKDSGLDTLLAALGIPWDRVFAAGDSPSDLGYVCRAGCGVMMGNASEAVRARAPHVAPPVSEDGLAEMVERWVLA